MKPHPIAVAALLALAGCSSGMALSELSIAPEYSIDEIRAAAVQRDIKVVVLGNPFGVAPEAFAGQVAAEMNQAAVFEAQFVAAPKPERASPYRVVWNFGPPFNPTPDELCALSAPSTVRRAPHIDVYAALCEPDNNALSTVRAQLTYTDTQNSIEFVTMVDRVTASLFPADPPRQRRDGGIRLAPIRHSTAR